MRFTILLFLSLSGFLSYSQLDYLVTKEGDTIYCKIKDLKRQKITYIGAGEKKKQYVYDFESIYFSDSTIIENPMGLRILEPEPGYANIYLFNPPGNKSGFAIEYRGKRLVFMEPNSFYLHRVKAEEVHRYNLIRDRYKPLTIHADEGKVYFLRCTYTEPKFINNLSRPNYLDNPAAPYAPLTPTFLISQKKELILDNPNIAKYVILTCKKMSQ